MRDSPRFWVQFDLARGTPGRAFHDDLHGAQGVRIAGSRVAVLVDARTEDEARATAKQVMRAALGGKKPFGAPLGVEAIGPPTRPKQLSRLPPDTEVREHVLADGRTIRAGLEGALGSTTVQVDDGPAWRDRDQKLAVAVALDPEGDGWAHAEFHATVRALFGRRTSRGWRFPCPACDAFTLDEMPPGTYDICSRCHWEDDNVEFDDPDYAGGANGESLRSWRARHGPAES